jgi:hypothetical protein
LEETVMQSVTIAKQKLVEILMANRAKHLTEYNAAVVQFRQAARKLLQDALDAVVPDEAPIGIVEKLKNLYITLEAPQQYLKEYDKALKMLDLSVKDEIEITNSEFSYYVEDDWDWKERFSASNRLYSSMSSEALGKAYKGGAIG